DERQATCDEFAPFWSFYVNFCTFCASLRLKRTVFTQPTQSLPTYQVGQCNPRLINDLRSTKAYVRKNNLFMQNKAKFQKVKMNVNNVLTKDYDKMDTWSSGTKQSQIQKGQNERNVLRNNGL
ncbi:MAG: hypothetical protein ACYSRR_06800, partial [Planctomycetota bacterium]